MSRVYNFSAGPAVSAGGGIEGKQRQEMLDYNGAAVCLSWR